MIVPTVVATSAARKGAKQPELENPHLVLAFLSIALMLIGLALIAASY